MERRASSPVKKAVVKAPLVLEGNGAFLSDLPAPFGLRGNVFLGKDHESTRSSGCGRQEEPMHGLLSLRRDGNRDGCRRFGRNRRGGCACGTRLGRSISIRRRGRRRSLCTV